MPSVRPPTPPARHPSRPVARAVGVALHEHQRTHPAPSGRPDRRRGLHDAPPGRDAAAHHRHPRRVPPVLLERVGGLDPDAQIRRLLCPRDPRPRRHVDRHGLARHRHGVRARLRRAQAPGLHPARPPPAPWRQDRDRHRGRTAAGGGPRTGRPRSGLEPRRRRRFRCGASRHRCRPPRHDRVRRHRALHGRRAQGR